MQQTLRLLIDHMRLSSRESANIAVGGRIFEPHEQRAIIQDIETLAQMASVALVAPFRDQEKDAMHEWLISQLLAMDGPAAVRLARYILEEQES